jgi:hypothetical protein
MDPGAELGVLLSGLKRNSGQSYEQLARKVAASKSTVHRYCAGLSVPAEFWTIERIARACKADKATVDRLYVLWSLARDPPDPPASGVDATPVEPAPPPTNRRFLLAAVGSGVVAVAVTALLFTTGIVPGRTTLSPVTSDRAPQQISGPAWTRPPAPVPRTLFGVTLSASTGNTPDFDVGALRLWDSSTRWSSIQPGPGVYDWTVLDRVIGETGRAGLPVMFVLGGTPAWAAPDGARSVYADGARAAPPDNLTDWDDFVRTLVNRFRGRIEAYELWVFANDHRFYTGSTKTLVEMTRRASAIVRAVDPAATAVCPGMGNLWDRGAQAVLREFAALGGYDHCDVAAVKLHQRTAADPPETMLGLLQDVNQIFHSIGIHPRIWNTGTTYTIALEKPLDGATATNFAVRFFLVGLYGRDVSLERMYFYNWGGTRIPIVLQADGGAPTPAARAVERLHRWLTGAESVSCGHGTAIDLPQNAWRCDLMVNGPDARRRAAVLWTHAGTATVSASAPRTVHRLDGRTETVGSGVPMEISEAPVLVLDGA